MGLPSAGCTTLAVRVAADMIQTMPCAFSVDPSTPDLYTGLVDELIIQKKAPSELAPSPTVGQTSPIILELKDRGKEKFYKLHDIPGSCITVDCEHELQHVMFDSDIERIFFLIDPTSLALTNDMEIEARERIEERVKERRLEGGGRSDVELRMVAERVVNAVHKVSSCDKICFTLVLTKSDRGYLSCSQIHSANTTTILRYLREGLGLGLLVDYVQGQFRELDAIAVSAHRQIVESNISKIRNLILN